MRIIWTNHSIRWILISNVSVTYDDFREFYTSDRISVRLKLFRKIDEDFDGFHTQVNSRVFDELYATDFIVLSCGLILLQHGLLFFLSSFLLDLFARMFLNLTMYLRVISPQTGNHSWSCRTSILEDVTFHEMNWYKFLWENLRRVIETFYHWDFFPLTFQYRVVKSDQEFGDRIAIISFYSARSKNHCRIVSWKCPLQSSCLLNWLRVREESKVFPNIYSISISTSHWRVTLTLHYDSYRRDLLLSVCVDHYKIFTSFSTLRCQVRSSSSGKYTMQYAKSSQDPYIHFSDSRTFSQDSYSGSQYLSMDSQVVTFNFFYPFRRFRR